MDLNGHTVAGSGAGLGITVRGRRGVIVAGGTIRGFVTGVMIAVSSGIVIKENRFTENREAVFLSASTANIIKENVAWQNQLRGIMIRPNSSGGQSTQNLVTENILIDNPSGILVFGQPGNTEREHHRWKHSRGHRSHRPRSVGKSREREHAHRWRRRDQVRARLWTGNRIIENRIELNTCCAIRAPGGWQHLQGERV